MRNPKTKDAIYKAVARAKKEGVIKTAYNCQKCGQEKALNAHHDDYSKPLDVQFLCVKCHQARHRELGWGVTDGKPKLSCEYNFAMLQDIYDFAILKGENIKHVSMLCNRFKNHTGRALKCFTSVDGVVVMRVK